MDKKTTKNPKKDNSKKIEKKEKELLAELKEQLNQAQESAQENYDKYLRLQAEMDNLRKRNAKDIQNAHKFALEKFAKSLLEVADSMSMGLKSANEDNADMDVIKDGLTITNKMFIDTLEKFNIVAINPQNEELNPEKHEAISIVPKPDLKSNIIVDVVQVGWELDGRVLRPAMVIVAQ